MSICKETQTDGRTTPGQNGSVANNDLADVRNSNSAERPLSYGEVHTTDSIESPVSPAASNREYFMNQLEKEEEKDRNINSVGAKSSGPASFSDATEHVRMI